MNCVSVHHNDRGLPLLSHDPADVHFFIFSLASHWGESQNVLPLLLLCIGLPETDFLCAARNPIAFSSPSSAVTSFPRVAVWDSAPVFASLPFFRAECSMWEDSARSGRSGSTVSKESQPLSSAWRWALTTWFWLRTRRWWENKNTLQPSPTSLTCACPCAADTYRPHTVRLHCGCVKMLL